MVIASSAIILENRKLLLIERSESMRVFPLCWACPGGLVEENESAEQAVLREVKEETNLDFRPTKLFSTGMYQDRNLYRFLGEWSGQVRIQKKEISKWGWFSYEDAAHLTFAFEYREVIEKLHKYGLI
ncbi:MAG: NUDIX hydrolase [Deltaproteobacteria bacterium]|nr:NUDIX hydrolase [Deltaproteobacteria bacterium]